MSSGQVRGRGLVVAEWNLGPVIDPILWKRMHKGMRVYKGRTFADKAAVMPGQVRRKVQYMMSRREHLTINGASIILAELCGVYC